MVAVAKFFLDFTTRESCGKCVHCRIGTKRMSEILSRIVSGEGKEGDVELLEELCAAVKDGALCGLGQSAPNPVLTTIRYFRDEYDAHIRAHRCPAKQCKALLTYAIDPEKCAGCSLCARKCPASAIHGELKKPFAIDPAACIRCGGCIDHCPMNLMPVEIERAYEKNDAEALKALKVGLCIECGCCAFQCPAHRPLVQVNKLSKTLVRDYDNRMKTLKEAGK